MLFSREMIRASVAGLVLASTATEAFVAPSHRFASSSSSRLYSDGQQQQQPTGRLERIEFKIYPDGRVEETVKGVQGESCLEVTRSINEKLGNVISTSPTEEMFQEEVTIDQTLYNSNTEGGSGDGGASWEGASSW
mmetsp:Transcript_26847/g.73841  ORF Transcript_26847/g.73841 Transcript_26847/m.73841 type:complete len:136 (-) Transcript_26847:323-730(-)